MDCSGGADFTGIQDAIDNASDGDTIIVYFGIYYENVVVYKSVTLRGVGQPVVDAGGEGYAITLSADGITLEGFYVSNSSWRGAGIKIIYSNNTITGNNASNNNLGISLYTSSNNTITGNNDDGICLMHSSSNNSITGNNVCNNEYGIYIFKSSKNIITGNTFVTDGIFVQASYQNTVKDNTVNGKPLVYLEDVSDYKVEDAGQVILVNCNNITVEGQDLSNTSVGIELWKTENCLISNNTISNNRYGIYLHHSSSNNIYLNNLINNTDNVDGTPSFSVNIWNSPLEITYTYNGTTYESYLGNYWDDYDGTDTDGDGIGDIHYRIDSYPLMIPFENYIT